MFKLLLILFKIYFLVFLFIFFIFLKYLLFFFHFIFELIFFLIHYSIFLVEPIIFFDSDFYRHSLILNRLAFFFNIYNLCYLKLQYFIFFNYHFFSFDLFTFNFFFLRYYQINNFSPLSSSIFGLPYYEDLDFLDFFFNFFQKKLDLKNVINDNNEVLEKGLLVNILKGLNLNLSLRNIFFFDFFFSKVFFFSCFIDSLFFSYNEILYQDDDLEMEVTSKIYFNDSLDFSYNIFLILKSNFEFFLFFFIFLI